MKIGDQKTEIKIAYLPTKVEGKIIWFKKYLQIYECVEIPIKIIFTFEEVEKGKSGYTTRVIKDLVWIKTKNKKSL